MIVETKVITQVPLIMTEATLDEGNCCLCVCFFLLYVILQNTLTGQTVAKECYFVFYLSKQEKFPDNCITLRY